MRPLLTFVLAIAMLSAARAAEPRVVIVSIDGLRPDCALRADMPNLRSLMKEGSFTFWATTTPVAITLPSHTSMVTGVTVERHGIKGNDDAAAANEKILVPTIFDLAKAAGISTGMSAGKSKFSIYAGPIDHAWAPPEKSAKTSEVADHAIEILSQFKPRLMYIHFPEVDSSGHSKGWGSLEQIAAIEETDAGLGRVLGELKKQGLYADTTIIVSADHGGGGKSHGSDTASRPTNQSIPWIIKGPGVRKNLDLTTTNKHLDVRTYDTFATACDVLGIAIPGGIDGKVVVSAFEGRELLTPATQPATQPAAQILELDGFILLPDTTTGRSTRHASAPSDVVIYADTHPLPVTRPWIGPETDEVLGRENRGLLIDDRQ